MPRQVECLICCDSYPGNEVFGMGCGHVYCLVRPSTCSSVTANCQH
jgi:hypothetical protein